MTMDERVAGWSCGDSEASGSRGRDAWGPYRVVVGGGGGRVPRLRGLHLENGGTGVWQCH